MSSQGSASHSKDDASETCQPSASAISVSSSEHTTSDNTTASATYHTAIDNSASEISTDVVDGTMADDAAWSSTSLSSLSKLLPKRTCTKMLSKPRPKRKELSTDEKVDLLVDAESQSLRKLAIKYGIGRRQVRNIIRRKKQIYKQSGTTKPLGRMRAYTLQTGNEEINLLTWQWYKRLTDGGIPVTGAMCQQKAREYARELRMNDFKGSNGWLQSFRKRHSLTFTTKTIEKKPDAEKAACSKKLPDIVPDDIAQLLQTVTSENISDDTEGAIGDGKQMPVIDHRSSEQPHIELPPNVSQMQQNTPEWTEWNKFIDSTFNEMAKRVNLAGPPGTTNNYHAMGQNYTMAAFSDSTKDHDVATSFRPSQASAMHEMQLSAFPHNQRRELIHDMQGLPSYQIASQMESYPPSSHVQARELYAPPHGPLKELYPHLQHSSLKEAYQQLPQGHGKESYPPNQSRTIAGQMPKQNVPEQASQPNDASMTESGKTRPTHVQLDNLYDVLRVTHQLTLFFRRTSEIQLGRVFEQAENEVRNDILSQSNLNK